MAAPSASAPEEEGVESPVLRETPEVRLKRRILQILTLAGLLLLLYGSIQAWRIRAEGLRQREVVAALEQAGFEIQERSAPSVGWLADLFGEEFFTSPTAVAAVNPAIDDAAAARLSELASLEKVTLAGADVGDATLANLAGSKNLTALYLADTSVTDRGLILLAALTKLERLDLTRTRVKGPGLEAVAKLPALRNLWLDGTSLNADAPTKLSASPSLVYLSLKSTGVRGESLASLEKIKTLESLWLDENQLTDADVGYLSEARQLTNTLSLYGAPVTDASVEDLGKFSSLKTLILEQTRITPEGLAMLQRILKETRILYP
jgi:Leucine-rich repeat (LRR) protein